VVESIDGRFEPVCIKGEERFPLQERQVKWFLSELLGNLGEDDLRGWSVGVIYDSESSSVLPSVITELFQHHSGKLEVRTLESLLPEVLLKRKAITLGRSVTVAIGGRCWQVVLTEEGRVSSVACLEDTVSEVRLTELDIPSALLADYAFTTNRKELERTASELADMTIQWDKSVLQNKELLVYIENLQKALADQEVEISTHKQDINTFMFRIIDNALGNVVDSNLFSTSAKRLLGVYLTSTYLHKTNDEKIITNKINISLNSIESNKFYIKNFFKCLNSKLIYTSFDIQKLFIRILLDEEDCPIPILQNLSKNKDCDLRKMVIWHPNCPQNIIKIFLQDQDESVRDAAQKRLQGQ